MSQCEARPLGLKRCEKEAAPGSDRCMLHRRRVPRRYVFVQDDSAHWYMIDPADREAFDSWVEWDGADGRPGKDFSGDRLDSHISRYSFADPRREE